MPEPTPLHDVTAKAGAAFAEQAGWQVPAHYGDVQAEYRSAREHAALFDVSHRGKVELTGSDAVAFLNNLCTNDVKGLAVGAGCEAFLATAKAKVVAHVLVYRLLLHGNRPGLWLDVTPGMSEKVLKHLDHYLVSEAVECADRTREFAQLHLCGPEAKAVLARALRDDVPDLGPLQHMMRTFGAGATSHVRRHDPLGLPGYDVVCLRARAETVWQLLTNAGARPAGLEAYEVLRVEAGTPAYGVDIDEERFAFEAGRTKQAICYTKGCYLGQEPIVMARDRGHANRTLLGLKVAEGGAAPRGARVLRDGNEVGQVTSSVVSPRLGAIALAYIRRGHQEPGTAVEVEADAGQRKAEVAALPFV